MYGGLVMEAADLASVSAGKSLHPYTRALLAASPRFGSHYTQERLKVIPGKVSDPSQFGLGCPFAPRCAEASGAGLSCAEKLPSLEGINDHLVRCAQRQAL